MSVTRFEAELFAPRSGSGQTGFHTLAEKVALELGDPCQHGGHHAPKHMHEELVEDYRDMIYAETAQNIEKQRKAFRRKWRLKCRAAADSLEEAGDRLFTFTRLDPSQWKSARPVAC